MERLAFYASIAVGTNNDPFHPEDADAELGPAVSTAIISLASDGAQEAGPTRPTGNRAGTVERETETELDVDALLLQLKILQNATDLPKKKGRRTLGKVTQFYFPFNSLTDVSCSLPTLPQYLVRDFIAVTCMAVWCRTRELRRRTSD